MASYDLESKNGALLLADDGVSLRPGGCCCGPTCCEVEIVIWQYSSGWDSSKDWYGSHYGNLSVATCPRNIACNEDLWSGYSSCYDSITCGKLCKADISATKGASTGGGARWGIRTSFKKGSGRLTLATFSFADTRYPSSQTFDTTVTTVFIVNYGAGEASAAKRPVVTATSARGDMFNGTLTGTIRASGSDISSQLARQTTNYNTWGGGFTTTITIE